MQKRHTQIDLQCETLGARKRPGGPGPLAIVYAPFMFSGTPLLGAEAGGEAASAAAAAARASIANARAELRWAGWASFTAGSGLRFPAILNDLA